MPHSRASHAVQRCRVQVGSRLSPGNVGPETRYLTRAAANLPKFGILTRLLCSNSSFTSTTNRNFACNHGHHQKDVLHRIPDRGQRPRLPRRNDDDRQPLTPRRSALQIQELRQIQRLPKRFDARYLHQEDSCRKDQTGASAKRGRAGAGVLSRGLGWIRLVFKLHNPLGCLRTSVARP